MVHIESYDSTEQMMQALAERAAHALAHLHPAQNALTFGDHWVNFMGMDDGVIEYGRVHLLREVGAAEVECGATPEEVLEIMASTEASLDDGYMYGTAYSLYAPEGELGTMHKAHVWPIPENLFVAARKAEWDHNQFPPGGAARFELELAFRSMKAHVNGNPS